MPKKPKYIRTLEFECIHCGRKHEIEVHDGMNISKGTIIKPSAGGGMWGRCRFCRKAGLRAITESPRPKKGPVGWRLPKSKSSKTESS
jgi:hypothetical protein